MPEVRERRGAAGARIVGEHRTAAMQWLIATFMTRTAGVVDFVTDLIIAVATVEATLRISDAEPSSCPSRARSEGGGAAEGRAPKQTAGTAAPAIAPLGLEPGLS